MTAAGHYLDQQENSGRRGTTRLIDSAPDGRLTGLWLMQLESEQTGHDVHRFFRGGRLKQLADEFEAKKT